MAFFAAEREHFFRPLTWQRRELYAACARSLFDQLYGPAAAYGKLLDRETLRDLFIEVLRSHDWGGALKAVDDESGAIDLSDEKQAAAKLIRDLEAYGWLESYSDRITLTRAYRFTKAGKLVAGALSALERPRAKTRQRNIRSAKNALSAFLVSLDPDDLIDSLEYAERAMGDLAEDIEYFAALLQALAREAAQRRVAWKDFADFLENKFRNEYTVRLVADSAERHLSDIREKLDQVRTLEPAAYARAERALESAAPWLAEELTGMRPLMAICSRVEEAVVAACDLKLPELRDAMQAYVTRFTSLLRQVMAQTSVSRSTYREYTEALRQADPAERGRLLDALAEGISCAKVRVLDPASIRFESPAERRRASNVSVLPRTLASSRLEAAMRRAAAVAFDVSDDEVLEALLRASVRGAQGLKLSELPQDDAREALIALHAVGVARGSVGRSRLHVAKLSERADTKTFDSPDYLFRTKQ